MKVRSSLIVPILAASILLPAAGEATVNQNTSTNASQQQHHEKGDKQQKLTNIINQYASPELKDQLTKDLATQKSLVQQLRQTPGFQKKVEQKKAQQKAFYQAHKQEIDSIHSQVKEGKLTKQQAHQQLQALSGQNNGEKDKLGDRSIYKELQTAVQKKDKAAINSALEKLDQHIQSSNQKLQQEIAANK
ncbi:hypothetical protein [Ectobacillus polymachus]|uniref:hypothetical protein n=1 Tax=Ectobacillus polymachus TaxID=1508806 RepID=UPI003A86E67A